MLRSVPLFAGCSKRQLEHIASIADELFQPDGTMLTTQGDRGREFLVLVEGAAVVRRNGRRVGSLGPGDFFGEMALLTNEPRMADVVAAGPVRTLVISDRAFARLLRESPDVQRKVLAALAERVAKDALRD